MNVNIFIDNQSTTAELLALAAFAEQLADVRAPAADTVITPPGTTPKNEPVRRGRKGAAAAATAEPAAPVAAEPAAQAPAATEPEPAAAEPAAQAPTTAASNECDQAKTYSEADVQALATVVARAQGPDVVKEKIAELGGTRIADLDAAKLNALGAFLEAQK